MCGGRIGASGRFVRPVPVLGVELARRVLGVALARAGAGGPQEQPDPRDAAGYADRAPDRVGEGGERNQGQVRSTTIVFTEAVTPSATSTMTT